MSQVKHRVREETGATSSEYAIMASLIMVLIVAAVTSIGQSLMSFFTNFAAGLVGS
jgi:Flp pilus assembly pilin Flp